MSIRPLARRSLALVAASAIVLSGSLTSSVAFAATAKATAVDPSVGRAAAAKLALGMTAAQQDPATAKAALARLQVAKPGTMSGYNRNKFPHWRDASSFGWPVAPNNKCDSRAAALYRDGVGVKMSSKCTKLTGAWLDPYTARTFKNASDIDIDHVVPLAEAWRSGASKWTTSARAQFANSSLVLVAVEDNANQSKGDRDPAAWKPANQASYCLYAERWIAVKVKFGLAVDAAEKAALTSMLASCDSPSIPTAPATPVPVPVPTPTIAPTPTPTSTPTPTPTRTVRVYANCTDLNADYPYGVARDSSVRNLVSGVAHATKAYVDYDLYQANSARDGDKDGIACER